MPGYYVHFASANPKTSTNKSFLCGIEAPDLLKKYFSLYGLEGAKEKYNAIKTNEMPEFSKFEVRLQQKELAENNTGLHYGVSSQPDIYSFWNSLTEEEKKNPFYIGYLWHLLTDMLTYAYLEIGKRFDETVTKEIIKQNLSKENWMELRKKETSKLHADWDKTNAKIKSTYPDVIIPEEIEELKIVKFINDDSITYVDWYIIKSIIDFMRSFHPLEENIDKVIEEVIQFLPDPNIKNKQEDLKKKILLREKR